jgi:hypothetical protein
MITMPLAITATDNGGGIRMLAVKCHSQRRDHRMPVPDQVA